MTKRRASRLGGLEEKIFTNFRGLNRRSDRLNSSPEFLYDLLNGFVRKDARSQLGVIVQRDGITKLNSTALGAGFGSTKSIRTIFEAKWNGGGTDVIIRAGTAWGKYDGSAQFDTIDTGRADDAIGQCVMFQNELLMVDGGIPRKMTAAYAVSTLSADANMPQDADAVWVHRDKVWLNSAATPMKAYFSKTNNANGATAFTGTTDAGTIDLSTVIPVGDRIRGFRTYGGVDSGLIAIICDKFTVIYQAGANVYDFTFVQYFPTTCVSINACDYVGSELVYPSRGNLTSLSSSLANNELDVNTLTEFIEPLYRSLVSAVTTTQYISGAYDRVNNLYYINFPATNNHQMLVYSVDIKNVVGRWTFPVSIFSMHARVNGDFLIGSNNYVYKLNTGTTDDGTAIEFKAAWPALYLGDPSRYKKPVEFEALVQNTANLTLNLDYWYGLSLLATDKITKSISVTTTASLWDVALWDVSYWDVQGNAIVHTADLLGRGRMMFLEIRNNTSGAKIMILWFLIRFITEGYV